MMSKELRTTIHVLLISLAMIGGIGNLLVALWYIWKKGKLGRGFLHVAVSVIAFLMIMILSGR
jgi:hypothetical protein